MELLARPALLVTVNGFVIDLIVMIPVDREMRSRFR